jgi:hypothetical protein
MAKAYRSAQGKYVDMDKIRLANEETIAIGNMKVNARGDELGFGGEVLRSRNEVMNDYYRLNTPTIQASVEPTMPDESQLHIPDAKPVSSIKGSLANQVLQQKTQQKILDDPDGEDYGTTDSK